MGVRKDNELYLDLDALPTAFPLRDIQQILEAMDRTSVRRRKLPAVEMVYFIIALGLMASAGAKRVLRTLLDGVRDREWFGGAPLASEAAIHKARRRLGYEPLRELFRRVARPIARKRTKGAWFRGRRLVTLDGSTLAVQDSKANVRAFGRPGTAKAPAAWPLIRFVLLIENGTRAPFAAAMGRWRKAETALAWEVIVQLGRGMLCLADRLFFSYALWMQALSTGSDLLWRVSNTLSLPRLRVFKDRSFLSQIQPRRGGKMREPIPVRVIEFTAVVGKRSETYRLITNILDPRKASAIELAHLYTKRWTIETVLHEMKTRLRGTRVLLRSRVPDLVQQDFWGLLLAYFGVRSLIHDAALEKEIEPSDISFLHALSLIITRLPEAVSFSPSGQAALP